MKKINMLISYAITAAITFAIFCTVNISTVAAAVVSEVSNPTFSAGSGFYGTDFELTLFQAENNTIYYTIDGSDPVSSETAEIYSAPITVSDRTSQPNIYSAYAEDENSPVSICCGVGYRKPTFSVDKAYVVRAAAKDENGRFSESVSQTYFITTGNLSKYDSITVVSIVTDPDNLFSPDKGIYVTGNKYIEWKNSAEYDPAKSVWDTDNVTNYFSKGREWEREASVTIFENGNAVVQQDMGIRVKGASTRNGAQKSFNLYARKDYGESKIRYPLIESNYSYNGNIIDKYDSITLRSVPDEVRLRDSFAQSLIHERETLTTQDMKPCAVFLNGEYWGSYQMAEKFSDYFIESNYGIPKKNVAMIKNWELEEGTQEEMDEFNNFMYSYCKKDLTNETNYKAVCDFLDIDSLIEHYAAGIYLGTYDWPNYNFGVWRNTGAEISGNPYSDGKWRFITFDLDYTMGATYENFGGVQGYAYDSFAHIVNKCGKYTPTNLFVQLMKNEDFRNRFAAVYCDYANEIMSMDKIDPLINRYSEEYTEYLANSQLRWWGYFGGTPESNLSYNRKTYRETTLKNIRTFFSERPEYTLEDMKNFSGLEGTLQTITLKTNGSGRIMINSIIPDTLSGEWSGRYYSDCPVKVTALPDSEATFKGWTGDIISGEAELTITLSEAMTLQANFTEKEALRGDVNSDGIFSIMDAVTLQKWLCCSGNIADMMQGDMNADGRVNIFDLAVMKDLLMKKK